MAAKEVGFAKEVGLKDLKNRILGVNCCEESERGAKEVEELSLYKIKIYLLLSLLSHAHPPAHLRVSRARVRKKSLHAQRRKKHRAKMARAHPLGSNRYYPSNPIGYGLTED